MNIFSVFTKTVGRKISLGYVLAVVLTVTIGAISYSSITSLNQTAEWVDHTHVVLAELERITSGLKDAETGQRGFLITNLENYLEPYNSAGSAVANAVAEVRDLTSDNPVQQGRLDDLEPLIQAKFDELLETIELRRDAGFDAALAVVLTDKGKAVMDNIRALIGEMSSEEADLLVIRDADAKATSARAIFTILLITGLSMLFLGAIGFFTVRGIVAPVRELAEKSQRVADGDLSAPVEVKTTDEIGTLGSAFNKMVESLKQAMTNVQEQQTHAEQEKLYLSTSVDRMLKEMEKFADGDLTINLEAERADEIGKLFDAVNRTAAQMHKIITQVDETVAEVDVRARQVSETSQTMAEAATEQAASLEEVSSAMEEIGSQTQQSSENATQANHLALQFREASQRGNQEMSDLITAMSEIDQSSKDISRIIKVIDEIAFQTNLLALNAAVEAARAGRHGKGFAVVAEEVRNLAARSAKAAKETADLIEDAVQKAENGSQIAGRTAEVLQEIADGSDKVTSIMEEIAASSNEQAQGIAQIHESLTQLDKVTQQSTLNTEQTATAAEELSGQSEQLRQMVGRFQLQGSTARRARVPSRDRSAVSHQELGKGSAKGRASLWDGAIQLDDDEFGRY